MLLVIKVLKWVALCKLPTADFHLYPRVRQLLKRPFQKSWRGAHCCENSTESAKRNSLTLHYSSELYNWWIECIAVWDYYDERNDTNVLSCNKAQVIFSLHALIYTYILISGQKHILSNPYKRWNLKSQQAQSIKITLLQIF